MYSSSHGNFSVNSNHLFSRSTTDLPLNISTLTSCEFCFTSGGKLEVPVDVTINGSSVKAVIDWMNKYNSMLNIIGNNA